MNELKNNLDLDILFTQLTIECDNIFDIYLELKKYEEAYEELELSDIVPDIYKAYELYHSHLDPAARIIKAITNADWSNLIDAFDFDKIIEKIPEEYKGILLQLIDEAKQDI